jgi:hypothetical protein
VPVLFANAFALLPGIERGYEQAVPKADSALLRKLRARLASMERYLKTNDRDDRITIATLHRLGSYPQIEVVYHEAGLPGATLGQLVIVKIGAQPHAYYPLMPDNPTWFSHRGFQGPLCVVGDLRCADAFWDWPLSAGPG